MKISQGVASFNKKETKIVVAALKLQISIMSNLPGDQKGQDTDKIDNYFVLVKKVGQGAKLDLKKAHNLDADNYASEIYNDLKSYLNYKASINTLTPAIKKSCVTMRSQIKKVFQNV